MATTAATAILAITDRKAVEEEVAEAASTEEAETILILEEGSIAQVVEAEAASRSSGKRCSTIRDR